MHTRNLPQAVGVSQAETGHMHAARAVVRLLVHTDHVIVGAAVQQHFLQNESREDFI